MPLSPHSPSSRDGRGRPPLTRPPTAAAPNGSFPAAAAHAPAPRTPRGDPGRGRGPAHAQPARRRRRPPRGRAEPPCGARRGLPRSSLPGRGRLLRPPQRSPPPGPSEPTAFPGEGAGRGLGGERRGAARAELTIYGQRQGRAAGRAGASWFVPLGAAGLRLRRRQRRRRRGESERPVRLRCAARGCAALAALPSFPALPSQRHRPPQ